MTGWLAPGCLVGSVLSVSALLADPDGAPERLAAQARGALAELEVLGRVAVALDTTPAALRPLLGLRPARDSAREVLGDGAAGIDRALASVTPLRPALRAARRAGGPPPAGLADAVATWITDAVRGPDGTVPVEATRAVAHLEAIPRAVERARLRLVLLVLGLGSLRWLEALGVALLVRVWLARTAPSLRPPRARSLDAIEGMRGRPWRGRAAVPTDPTEVALVTSGVPARLAAEIAGRFAEAPDWPGSLRGHDREPGGLQRHTRRVIERMTEQTAGWPAEARTAAAVVAAAHDLGKLVAYRRVGPGRWVGHGGTPHDSLSAILLGQCPSWRGFASAEAREAILQCLASEHAPEGLSANAPPLAQDLLAALRRADAAAAREGGSDTARPTEGSTDAA